MTKRLFIGADPELFIQKDGKIVSAHDLLPGTKTEPHPVRGGAIQVDGTAAEFNIVPATSIKDFVDAIKSVTDELSGYIPLGSELVALPTAHFDPEYFKSLPVEAKLLGCEPDYNAWNHGKVNSKPKPNVTFRTGGGHIHLGWTEDEQLSDVQHFNDCIEMTKQLDLAMYIPSLFWDKDRERQRLYGAPGAFRPKPYGVEYRPLSNAWVADKELCAWVFSTAYEAWHMLQEEEHILSSKPELVKIFKNKDRTAADCDFYLEELYKWGFPALPAEYLP